MRRISACSGRSSTECSEEYAILKRSDNDDGQHGLISAAIAPPEKKQLAFALLVIERMLPDLICFTQETGFDNSCFLSAKELAWSAFQSGSVAEDLVEICKHNAPDTEAFVHELTSYALNAALGIAEIAEFTIDGDSAHLASLLSLMRDSTDLYLSSLYPSILSYCEQNNMVEDSRIMKQERHREEEDLMLISDLPDELDERAVSGLRDRASGYTALLPLVRCNSQG